MKGAYDAQEKHSIIKILLVYRIHVHSHFSGSMVQPRPTFRDFCWIVGCTPDDPSKKRGDLNGYNFRCFCFDLLGNLVYVWFYYMCLSREE